MQFKYSGGRTNSIKSYLINIKSQYRRFLYIVVSCFILFFLIEKIFCRTQHCLDSSPVVQIIVQFIVCSTLLIAIWIQYRKEMYLSFEIKQEKILIKYKNLLKTEIPFSMVISYRILHLPSNEFNVVIYYKKNSLTHLLSFGYVDEELAGNIDDFLKRLKIKKILDDEI